MRLIKLTGVAICAIGTTVLLAVPYASAEQWTFNAGMNGSREVPGPGDVGASGHARITVDRATGEICWRLTVRNMEDPATAAHIHVGDRNEAGPIVQPLTPPTSGSSSGCEINKPVAEAIVADPSAYYVNVHSEKFGGGAVRGQLAGRHG